MRKNSDPWLRFYVRTLNNPKVQRLPGNTFKGWVNLLCLSKETDGVLPPVEDISFRLRLSKSKSEVLINTLKTNGLIDGNKLHDWDEMQYPSDSSTERVQRHRERHKEQACNVPSNVSETVQSRTEQIRTEPPISPSERGTGNSPNGRQKTAATPRPSVPTSTCHPVRGRQLRQAQGGTSEHPAAEPRPDENQRTGPTRSPQDGFSDDQGWT